MSINVFSRMQKTSAVLLHSLVLVNSVLASGCSRDQAHLRPTTQIDYSRVTGISYSYHVQPILNECEGLLKKGGVFPPDLQMGSWELLLQACERGEVVFLYDADKQPADRTSDQDRSSGKDGPAADGNSATTISYALPKPDRIRITIYDMLGRQLRALVDSRQSAGRFQTSWDGRDEHNMPVAAGVYLCKLQTDQGFMQMKKLLLLK